MSHLLLVLLLLLMGVFSKAQTVVSGVVTDSRRQPVPGASITIKDSYDGATADSAGRFQFQTTEKGQVVLVVSCVGFLTAEVPLEINGEALRLQLLLKQEITEMSAVVISAGAFEASDRKRAAAVLSSLDIVTTASANADVTGALKTLPGAQQVGESEGLFVRGGTAAETKIFIDGTLVNNFFGTSVPGIAQRGRFSPFLFKGTVFSTGGYSALYGQALSSALLLESIDLPDQSSAQLNISVINTGVGFQQLNQKKNASWGINYNYTNLDLAFALIKQQQIYSRTPAGHNLETNFRFKTSRNGLLKYYGYYNYYKLAFTVPSLDSLGYFDRFGLTNANMYHNLSWKEQLKNKWRLQAGVSFSLNRDEIQLGMEDDSGKKVQLGGLAFVKNFEVMNNGAYANTRLVVEKRFRGLNALRFGTEWNYSKDRAVFTRVDGQLFLSSVRENLLALFAEQDLYITNNLAGKFGVRAERSELLNRNNIAPRISLAYKTGRDAQASLAYGQFFQNPERQNLPAVNPLRFQKATHYIAQYQKSTSVITFRTELFYKKYEDLIKTRMENNQLRAADNNGFGYAKGFEIFWRDKKTVKNLDYWISYSFLDTKRDFANFPFAITPTFAARHTASFVMKKFVSSWKTNVNLSYNYASRRLYYHILPDPAVDGKFVFGDKGYVAPYHNVSFALNYLPKMGKKDAKSFVVYVLSISNVLNFKQQFGYTYSLNGQRRQEVVPPSRMFVFIGAFFSFGVDRTEDAINNNL